MFNFKMAEGGYVGNVPYFNSKELCFDEWLEILEAWFIINEITDNANKRAALITKIGTKGYKVMRSLVQPSKPLQTAYDVIVKALKAHYTPPVSEIMLRFHFHKRHQHQGENISQFVAELRRLSDGCNFTDVEEMLRDRLVVGIRDVAIQGKLLSKKKEDLTFKNTFAVAVAMETARKDVQDIKSLPKTEENVNKVYSKKERSKKTVKSSSGHKSSASKSTVKTNFPCWRCGNASHQPDDCSFKKDKCHKCSKLGHTKSQCEKVKAYLAKKRTARANLIESDSEPESDNDEVEVNYLMHLTSGNVNKIEKVDVISLPLIVNSQSVPFEMDTGSPWSIVSKKVYDSLGDMPPIKSQAVSLRDYNGSPVEILGSVDVNVQLAAQSESVKLPLLITSKGASLCGRQWLSQLGIQVQGAIESAVKSSSVQAISAKPALKNLDSILDQEAEVFNTTKLGKLKGYQAKVYPVEEAKTLFYKASSVAYSTKVKLDAEIEKLLEQEVIEPVRYSDYACPLVIAKKSDGNIRICGNYKLTANKVLRLEKYPIPSLEDLLQSLQGGVKFSKLDLSHAYHQIELDEDARKFTTVNTHRGLFRFCRLPFGIASAPAIFQRTMESLLGDIPMCKAYLDDVIISGRNDAEHLANLETVLSRLRESGLRLKRDKCSFLQESITYLGHRLDASGIRPVEDKVSAIKDAPEPQNQEELQSFLGLLGYYRKFIPNLSKEIAPLNELLQKKYKSAKKSKTSKPSSAFQWGSAQKKAFKKAKELLSSDTLLVHYNSDWPVLLQCDASPYGLGSVISHVLPDGSERPIAFASRSLSPAEKNYAQYEREALAIIFGLTKFHKYLHGRSFTIVTDHKPLLQLFGEKPVSPMASARITRWQMLLGAHQYEIRYKPGKEHCNADGLSRLPLKSQETEEEVSFIHLLSELDSSPITAQEIKSSLKKDLTLSRVREYLRSGWPSKNALDDQFLSFYSKRDELSVEDDIVLYGPRVVVPNDKVLRQKILAELHATHPGIVKMKLLARSYVWWPQIDSELEQEVRTCSQCQENQRNPVKVPIHPWEFPENPWERVHLDFASIDGVEVLIAVDAYSKWIEAVVMKSTTAQATIKVVRQMFARYGLPETIVTDNGPQFTCSEFFDFLVKNGVRFVQTPPKHPASNGLAERAVQTVKKGVGKLDGSLKEKIEKFLFRYRVTPQSTTGKMPCELLMRRKLRTRLDLIKPSLNKKVKRAQSGMKEVVGGKTRTVSLKDQVLVKNFSWGPTWLRGVVESEVSSSIWEVRLEDGRLVRRHLDQIQKRVDQIQKRTNENVIESGVDCDFENDSFDVPIVPSVPVSQGNRSESQEIVSASEPVNQDIVPNVPESGVERRVSTRVRNTPVRFKDYVKN